MSTSHDGPMAANLLGRWEFPNFSGVIDAGLIDGIPQKDATFGQARLCAGRFNTGSDRDAPVDLSEGTIAVQFTPNSKLGLSSDTLVSHGAFEQRSTKGFFEFRMTYKGHIKVMHFANGENITLGTESDFFNPGDIVEATYCWSAAEGGTFLAENLSQGTSKTVYSATTGLTMDIGNIDNVAFTFAACDNDDEFFDGSIDYVAVYDLDILNASPGRIASGKHGDDMIDLSKAGGPSRDRIATLSEKDGFGNDASNDGHGQGAPVGSMIDCVVDGDTRTTIGKVLRGVDTLDLTGAGEANNPEGFVVVDYDLSPENGAVRFMNALGALTGELRFEDIENVIEDAARFVPGTLIATPKGELLIENLKVGDRVITRDNGLQDIKWIGQRFLSEVDLLLSPRLTPVMIRAGALGPGVPEADTMFSPNHRVLVSDGLVAPQTDEKAVLVAAMDLTELPGVELMDPQDTTYVHMIFARHEVVLCNGAWTESFHAGDQSFRGAGNAQRMELLELYPELRTREGLDTYKSAQQSLNKHKV